MLSLRRCLAPWTMLALLACTAGAAGCAQTIAGMVVKHVAMSAAKKVVVDQYNAHKERENARQRDKAYRAHAAAADSDSEEYDRESRRDAR